jgi:hypothetical protein
MTSPPPPDPGTDCIPAFDCAGVGGRYAFVDRSTRDIADKPIELFIDIDGYAWLRVTEYGWHPADGMKPLHANIWKSSTQITCVLVKAEGATGFDLAAISWTFQCVREYTGWLGDEDVECCTETECESLFDFSGATVSATVFSDCSGLCDESPDECNPPGEQCPGETCGSCPDGVTAGYMLVDLDFTAAGCTNCPTFDGSYVLPFIGEEIDAVTCIGTDFRTSGLGVCVYRDCFPFSVDLCGLTAAAITISAYLWWTTSPVRTHVRVEVEYNSFAIDPCESSGGLGCDAWYEVLEDHESCREFDRTEITYLTSLGVSPPPWCAGTVHAQPL